MESKNDTQFHENSLRDIANQNNIYDAVDFLKNPENFRDFNEGLKELMYRKGFSKKYHHLELSNILYTKLQAIGSSITHTTIDSWFNGTHRPKIEAGYRKQIYEICFAMELNCEDTKWFFQRVYYDRAFNCHTIDESVYYYAFLNKLSYTEAKKIIIQINNAVSTSKPINNIAKNYTQFVKNQIENFKSTDELITFLIYHKDNFESWNQSAYEEITNRIQELIPTDKGKKEIDNLKRTIMRKNSLENIIPKLSAQKEWGLIMQEFFSTVNNVEDLSYISGLNIQSNAFILRRILSPYSCDIKIDKVNLPYIVKNNFPTRKTMSDTLSMDKISHSKSYDSIRKIIILLNFYTFWVRADLGYLDYMSEEQTSSDTLYDAFLAELNTTLYDCGYEYLYAGNPYDWLFLCASLDKKPLTYFRFCIEQILSEKDDI